MSRRGSLLGVLVVAALILFFQWSEGRRDAPADPLPGAGERVSCTVSRITDGDSIECGDATRVRLLSIDAPELDQAPYGEMARERLASVVPVGSRVSLELDVETRDDYGRLLAYLHLPGGRMANELMASSGYAVDLVYRPNVRYAERIRNAVRAARRDGRGLWQLGAFDCLPRDFRADRCEAPRGGQ